MSVEVLAGSVVPHGGAGSAWRAAIWTSRRSTQASSMVVTKVCRSNVRVHRGDLRAAEVGQAPQPAGGAVTIHPGPSATEEDGAARAVAYGPFDGPSHRRRQRYQDDLVALAVDAEDPVAVLLAEVGDVCAGSLKDPQPEQS